MDKRNKARRYGRPAGFTLVEIIVVVVILGIAALIAVPMMSSAADVQVRSAANRLAADLEYAKNMAVTNQKAYTVTFDAAAESYAVMDGVAAVPNPVNPSRPLQCAFSSEHGLSSVVIDSAEFVASSGTETSITFDYLGTPYAGDTVDSAYTLNSGTITLKDASGMFTLLVRVEPMTGYITIESP